MNRITFASIATIMASSQALANTGHGAAAGIVHFLTAPDHLTVLSASVFCAALLFHSYRRRVQ